MQIHKRFGHSLILRLAVGFVLMTGFLNPPAVCAEDASTLGLPPLPASATPPSAAVIELGRQLFFDARLSRHDDISCASCHQPDQAFTDHRPVARGTDGQEGTRNTPSVINVTYAPHLLWDGRRERLEDMVLDPLLHPLEHGLENAAQLQEKALEHASYRKALAKAYGKPADQVGLDEIRGALAAYLRTLRAGNSAFDRYYYGKQETALSAAALAGLALFRGRAQCETCHTLGIEGALFTDFQFHSLAVGLESLAQRLPELATRMRTVPQEQLGLVILTNPPLAALGRYAVTRLPADIGKFRTPSLRDVALTAPYMHDGSVPTLEEAVERELYYRSLTQSRPIVLNSEEKRQLVEFLKSLSSATAKRQDG